jgi:hypothetical protein
MLAVTPATETRVGGQVAAKFATAQERLVVATGVFHETVHGHEFRDWSWEHAHASTEFSGSEVRAPMSTSVAPDFVREGWLASISYTPRRSISARATWSTDLKNQGPTRGGNVRGSMLASYEFRSGWLSGFVSGAALHYRNSLVFDDGFVLLGGWRADLMLGYRWLHAKQETSLQLNLVNLANRSWQLTRFTPDHGRQVFLTATQKF